MAEQRSNLIIWQIFFAIFVFLAINGGTPTEAYGHLYNNIRQQQQQQLEDETPLYTSNINPYMKQYYRGGNHDLSNLNEQELETLLHILEKVKSTENNDGTSSSSRSGGFHGKFEEQPVPLNYDATRSGYIYDKRTKRTGHPQKKSAAFDWEDYWGIDKKKKRSSSPIPNRTFALHSGSSPHAAIVGPLSHHPLFGNRNPIFESHKFTTPARTTSAPVVSTTTTAPKHVEKKEEHQHGPAVAAAAAPTEDDAEKEQQLQQFYRNMAMVTNIRKRKRSVNIPAAILPKENVETQAQIISELGAKLVAKQDELMTPAVTTAQILPVDSETPAVKEATTSPPANNGSETTTTKIVLAATTTAVSAVKNTSDNNVGAGNATIFLSSTTTTTAAVTPTTTKARNDMSRGDLEKLKARLTKQIGAAYSPEQLHQILRDTSREYFGNVN